jgi:hypothetical protein
MYICIQDLNDPNLPYLSCNESVQDEMHPALWSVANYSMGMLFHRGDPNNFNIFN